MSRELYLPVSQVKSRRIRNEEEEDDTPLFGMKMPKIFIKRNHVYFYDDVTTDAAFYLVQAVEDAYQWSAQVAKDCGMGASQPVYLHIMSYGGDAYAGIFLYDALKKYRDVLVTVAEGIVASAATMVLLAAGSRQSTTSSMILMHQPSVSHAGNTTHEVLDTAENMRNLKDKMAQIYVNETCLALDEINNLLEHDYTKDAKWMLDNGIIAQYADGYYDPEVDKSPAKKMIEAEAAEEGMDIYEYLGLPKPGEEGCTCELCVEEPEKKPAKKDKKDAKQKDSKSKSGRGSKSNS